MKNYFFACLTFLFFNNLLFAQKNIKGNLASYDTTDLNVIKVSPDSFPAISVLFEALKHNNPIFGLKKEQIRVKENDEPCKILSLKEVSENYPIKVALIIDHSGSMMQDRSQLIDSVTGNYLFTYDKDFNPVYPEGYIMPIENAKKAAKEFIKEINRTKDSVQIIGFSTDVDIWSSYSNNNVYLNSIIDTIKPTLSTAFLDAINLSLDSIKSYKGLKVVIALTDGLDNASHVSVQDVIKKSRELKVPVYTVGLGDVDQEFLKSISDKTNGAFYYTKNSNSLTKIYLDIQKRIHSIYDLRYVSSNLNPDDTVRKIKIEFEIDSLYLQNNLVDLQIPSETIKYIVEKQQREKIKLYGYVITGTLVGAGILVYVVRRRGREKNKKV